MGRNVSKPDNRSGPHPAAESHAWPAPAKLNLFLHITGRRPDGYHLLQTVFQFLDYGDELEFCITAEPVITVDTNYDGVIPEEDLVYRAARLLQHRTATNRGARIKVRKRLPMGGGLGGGSSDAATTLVALNHFWETGCTGAELAAMGLELGADVPVFIHGQAAWAEGTGEVLYPVTPPENWYVVANPGIHVPTAEVFSAQNLTRNTPAITIRDFLAGAGVNNCEPVVRSAYPGVAQLIDWLEKRTPARLTGTGSCVFGVCNDKDSARRILAELPSPWTGFVARGVNHSPLSQRLDQENCYTRQKDR